MLDVHFEALESTDRLADSAPTSACSSLPEDPTIAIVFLPQGAAEAEAILTALRKVQQRWSFRPLHVTPLKLIGWEVPSPSVTMPLTAPKLHRALSAILNPSSNPTASSSTSNPTPAVPVAFPLARVLIADDVPMNRRVLSLKLQQMGFSNITEAGDGLEALRMIQESSTVFSAIMMDVCFFS